MSIGHRDPPFMVGVVEDRMDPLKIGRVRVRVVGLHTHDKTVLPTEDLPWFACIQPVSASAIGGVGQAPVGPLPGTWVAVQFMDADKQNGFVTGTIPGISHPQGVFTNAPNQGGNYEVKPNGEVVAPWLDYGNVPVGDGKFNLAGTFFTSDPMIEKLKAKEAFRARPYKPTAADRWTIGYGTTYIDGAPVRENTPEITEPQAVELLKKDVALFEAAIKAAVTKPITQSMFDAMVSLTYNIGPGGFRRSDVLRFVNEGNYSAAADAFLSLNTQKGTVLAGLTARRQEERAWFLREGTGEPQAAAMDAPVAMAMQAAVSAGGAGVVAGPQVEAPLEKIMMFGPADSFRLPEEEKKKIVAGPVKILTKEEYVANIYVPAAPGQLDWVPEDSGGSGDSGSSDGKNKVWESNLVRLEVTHPDWIKPLEGEFEKFLNGPLLTPEELTRVYKYYIGLPWDPQASGLPAGTALFTGEKTSRGYVACDANGNDYIIPWFISGGEYGATPPKSLIVKRLPLGIDLSGEPIANKNANGDGARRFVGHTDFTDKELLPEQVISSSVVVAGPAFLNYDSVQEGAMPEFEYIEWCVIGRSSVDMWRFPVTNTPAANKIDVEKRRFSNSVQEYGDGIYGFRMTRTSGGVTTEGAPTLTPKSWGESGNTLDFYWDLPSLDIIETTKWKNGFWYAPRKVKQIIRNGFIKLSIKIDWEETTRRKVAAGRA